MKRRDPQQQERKSRDIRRASLEPLGKEATEVTDRSGGEETHSCYPCTFNFRLKRGNRGGKRVE